MNFRIFFYTKTYVLLGDTMIFNYMKSLGYSLLFLILSSFIITFFSYFNFINETVLTILEISLPIISFFIAGILIGRKANKKGYLEGLKVSLLMIVFIFLFNLLAFGEMINLKNALSFLIWIASSMFGSIIGINKSKN